MPESLDPAIAGLTTCCWIHSHEEDAPGEAVYRPEEYRFPPARGRDGFQLLADGTLILIAPGRADRGASRTGRWHLREDGTLVFCDATGERSREIGQVIALDAHRLILRLLPA